MQTAQIQLDSPGASDSHVYGLLYPLVMADMLYTLILLFVVCVVLCVTVIP